MPFMPAFLDPQLLYSFSAQSKNSTIVLPPKKSSKMKMTTWDTILMASKGP